MLAIVTIMLGLTLAVLDGTIANVALPNIAPITGRLSDRHSPALLGRAGLVLLGKDASVPDVAWRMALCGFGFGLFQSPNNRAMIGSAPKSRSGAASGALGTARLTGQSIGATLVALMLAQFELAGAGYALYLGAGYAALAAIISSARFAVQGAIAGS